jgi:hypothetical protein
MRTLRCLSLFLSLGVIMCSRKDPDAAGKPRSGTTEVPSAAGSAVEARGKAPMAEETPVSAGKSPEAAGSPTRLAFALAGDSVYLLKVADSERLPEGGFLGEEEFGPVRKTAGGRILIHVVVPNSLGQVAFRHSAGGKSSPLAEVRYIFRNPSSPRHTFAIVDAADPGRIEGTTGQGASGGIDLGPLAGTLRAMPFHWNRQDSGSITYQGLPASLNGRMPR